MNIKNNEKTIGLLIAILVVLVINIGYNVWHLYSYNIQKQAGNDRWLQVEKRILEIENKVNKEEK